MHILFRHIDFAPRLFAESLLNSIWQGALLALFIWLLLRLCGRKVNAATRYSIWFATLLAIVSLPFLNAFNSSGTGIRANLSTSTVEQVKSSPDLSTEPRGSLQLLNKTAANAKQRAGDSESHEMARTSAEASLINERGVSEQGDFSLFSGGATAEFSAVRERFVFVLSDTGWSRVFLLFWMLGVAMMLTRLARSYLSMQRYKRESVPLAEPFQERLDHWLKTCAIKRAVSLRSSERISAPLILGLRETVILFPERLARQLAEEEFDQVLLHELAHARRRDDWTNLLQKLFEACLFFHPIVWWTGRQLNSEREMACDQWVVNVTGAHRSYASCLTRLFELTERPSAPLLAPGALRLKSHLAIRIETILKHQRGIAPHLSTVRLIIPLIMLCLMLLEFVRLPPVIAINAREASKTAARQATFDNANTVSPMVSEEIEQEAARPEAMQNVDASESTRLYANRAVILPPYAISQDAPFQLQERAANIQPSFMRPVAFVSTGAGTPKEVPVGASPVAQDGPKTEQAANAQGANAQRLPNSQSEAPLSSLFRTISASDSPGSQRELLTAMLKTGEPAREFLVQALTVAKDINSDGEKAEFLIYAARVCSNDAAVLNAYLNAVASIKSDGEQRRVLAALLKLKGQDRLILSRALKAAALIDSDGEKAELLVMAARLYAIDGTPLPAFLGTVSTINSAGERRRVLTAALRQGNSGTEVLVQVVKAARAINSDGEKAEFLVRVSEVCQGSDALLAAYLATAATLNSAEEKRRALNAMTNMSGKKAVGQGFQTQTMSLARNGGAGSAQ